MLVEPNPALFAKLLKKHRNAYALNACLSPTNESQMLKFRTFGLRGGLDQLGEGSFKSTDDSQSKQSIDVPCFPLHHVMEAIGVSHIHYLSLDVEGAELDILKTIPWDKLRIDTMTIEYSMFDGKIKVFNIFFGERWQVDVYTRHIYAFFLFYYPFVLCFTN